MSVNVAVVGCGHWGKNHVRNFAELGALKAVVDPDAKLAASMAEQFGATAMVDAAFAAADKAFDGWDRLGGPARAGILRKMADALEADTARFIAIVSREAGKTLSDGVAEVREAVDFLRYYAAETEAKFSHADP